MIVTPLPAQHLQNGPLRVAQTPVPRPKWRSAATVGTQCPSVARPTMCVGPAPVPAVVADYTADTGRRRFGPSLRTAGLTSPQAASACKGGRLAPPRKKRKATLRAIGLAFFRARLPLGLSARRCSGAKSGPVWWWPCFAPSAWATSAPKIRGGYCPA